jgi:hypothetical protein
VFTITYGILFFVMCLLSYLSFSFSNSVECSPGRGLVYAFEEDEKEKPSFDSSINLTHQSSANIDRNDSNELQQFLTGEATRGTNQSNSKHTSNKGNL